MDNDTKTMDSIISEATKDGIDFGINKSKPSPVSESTPEKDAPLESSPKAEETKVESTKVAETGEQSVDKAFQESKLPAHLFPRFKEVYEEKKKLQEQLKSKDALLADPRIVRLLAQKNGQVEQVTSKSEKPDVMPELNFNGNETEDQKVALQQLSKMLGLDKVQSIIDTLEKRNQELESEKETEAFDREETEIKKLSNDFGLDYETEVYPALSEWLTKNAKFQGLGPGTLKFAFNNVFFSRMGELEERKANLKMIEEQKKRKQGNAEVSSKSEKSNASPLKGDIADITEQILKESGGLENVTY